MNAQSLYLQTIERLLEENEVDKAIDALLTLDEESQAGLRSDIVMQSGNFREASKMFQRGVISFDQYRQASAHTRYSLLELMKEIPGRLELNARVRNLNTFQFEIPDEQGLQKLLGDRNNLLRINWLEKALQASKAVCRVVCGDGELGTGFLTRDGYIFTNNHVIPDVNIAKETHVEFNYELDAEGKVKSRTRYELDAADFVTSPVEQFDYTRIKVVDRNDAPLSQWGFLEFDPEAIPTINEPVTIIQHPKGEDKQIALNANDVISVWDKYLFYTTDTEPGSSGSPVFNKDWKVVALHHAGKTTKEGGLQINARGDRQGANRGILFKYIFQALNGAPANTPSQPSAHESFRPDTNHAEPITQQPEPPKEQKSGPVKLVFVYDEVDRQLCDRLNNHLFVLKSTKKIEVYNVHKAKPGEDTALRAKEEIESADYVLCLITPNLFNDEAPWFGMVLEALSNGKKVIPVYLQKVDLDGTGLEKLQALPSKRLSVSEYANPDQGYKEIADGIKSLT